MEQPSQTINPRRFLSLLSHLTSEHWLFICFIYIAPFMSFHQQVCLYGKLMASQSCSLRACVWVYVCACLCAFIHIFYVGISTHGFASVCVSGWAGVCVCSILYLQRENQHFQEAVFFFFLSNITLPRFSLSTSLYLLTSLSLPPPSSCVPQFFIPSLIIYHHYSTTTWYDKYQTWVVYRYSICFLSQRLLTEAFSLTWIARWGTDFSHNWI